MKIIQVYKYYPFLLFINLLIISNLSYAQIDTTLFLTTIEVSQSRLQKFNSIIGKQSFDLEKLKDLKTNNLADLLAQRTSIAVKSYGLGSLATLSTRGTSANHTALLWNGFNLQNSMNGTVDFALIPTQFSDNISVQKGASSALFGSGAIGGTIALENKNELDKGLKIEVGSALGSFSDRQEYADISFSQKKWSSSINAFHHTAQNDFLISKNSTARQTNAQLKAKGLSQSNTFQFTKKQHLKTFLWWQDNQRQIPSSRTESNTNAQQEDKWLRIGTEYALVGKKHILKARFAWLQESLLYYSSMVDSAYSEATTGIVEIEEDLDLGKNWQLNLGLNYTHQKAEASEIEGLKSRQRLALFSSVKKSFFSQKITSILNLRQEWTEETSIPLTASWSNDLQFHENWKANIRAARSYNLPTFNDLFWKDFGAIGNIDLLPESAWNYESGIQYTSSKLKLKPSFSVNIFSNHIKNLIQWRYLPTSGILSPTNNKSVWARGVESTFEIGFIDKKTKIILPAEKENNLTSPFEVETKIPLLHFGINAAYTQSTVQAIYANEEERFIGKQLIYTPLWTGSTHFKIQIKKLGFLYQHSFSGKRYTTTDNSEEETLPSFAVGNLNISRSFYFKKIEILAIGKVLNIFNSEYEVLQARPMPLRHFQVEVRLIF